MRKQQIFFFLALLTVLLSSDFFFFWDTIQLSSKHAHWFYDNNFKSFWLPEEMDSGHFPIFGIYLAFCWSIFGKTLLVSHLAMLPFLFGVFYYLLKIGEYFLGKSRNWCLALLFFVEPVFLGQSVLVTPDIAVICFFFMALYSILFHKKFILPFATIALALLSMRGMMIVVSIYLFLLSFEIINEKFSLKSSFSGWFFWFFRKALPFVPSGIIAFLFLFFHYQQTGWIGYHPDSPWAVSFEKVNFGGFIKNIGILAWRILDYGRVFLFVPIFIILFKIANSDKVFFSKKLKTIFALLSVTILTLTPSLLIHKGLLLHRYLLPVLFSIDLLAIFLISKLVFKKAKIWFIVILAALASGNLWVYPKHIAQGWDATLAHVPYYDLREKMIDYIEEERIEWKQIGSAFPNISGFEYTDLKERNGEMVKFDFTKNDYIFYSNIMNDFSDEELLELEKNWNILKKFKSGGVFVILYKK